MNIKQRTIAFCQRNSIDFAAIVFWFYMALLLFGGVWSSLDGEK